MRGGIAARAGTKEGRGEEEERIERRGKFEKKGEDAISFGIRGKIRNVVLSIRAAQHENPYKFPPGVIESHCVILEKIYANSIHTPLIWVGFSL